MSIRNVTSLGPNFGPFWQRKAKNRSSSPIYEPRNFSQIFINLGQPLPKHLELVAAFARPYFNFVSFTLWSATHHNETVPVHDGDRRLTLVTWTAPAVQIQENEVMQVASLCNTVEPALAGNDLEIGGKWPQCWPWLNFFCPILEQFCPLFRQIAHIGLIFPKWGLILPRIPPANPVLAQSSQTPFWDMYRHKTPPNPPPNTSFPCLILKVGKMIYCLGKMDPIWAKCVKSGQNFSRSGQKNIYSSAVWVQHREYD